MLVKFDKQKNRSLAVSPLMSGKRMNAYQTQITSSMQV